MKTKSELDEERGQKIRQREAIVSVAKSAKDRPLCPRHIQRFQAQRIYLGDDLLSILPGGRRFQDDYHMKNLFRQ